MNNKKFIIITKGRSGSTFLNSLLNSSSEIISYGEFFRFEQYKKGDKNLKKLIFYPFNYFYKSFYKSKSKKNIGFKMLYHQINLKHLINYTNNNNIKISKNTYINFLNDIKKIWQLIKLDKSIKIIHLNRKNLLHTYTSFKVAEKTNEWHTTNCKSKNNDIKISINKNNLLSFLEKTTNEILYFNTFFKKHNITNIYYEDLNQKKTIKNIKSTLGINDKILTSNFKKQITKPYNKIIINYSQLKKDFIKTKWNYLFK